MTTARRIVISSSFLAVGGMLLLLAVAISAPTAQAADSRIEPAINWGMSQIGTGKYTNGVCLAFVNDCYEIGVGSPPKRGYMYPIQVAQATNAAANRNTEPPRGTWVYWDLWYEGERTGHVAMSLGDGRVMEAWPGVGVRVIRRSDVPLGNYIGWSAPELTPPLDLSTPPPPAPTLKTRNLLANASFEHTLNGWRPVAHATSVNYARYKDAAYAHDGAGYLETNTRTGGASMAQDVAVTTKPGQSYSFSVWLRTRGSTPVSGTLALWGLGGTAESGQTRFTVGPQWTLVSATLDVANPGHTALRAEIYMGTVNVNLDVDGAQLVNAGLANASFEHTLNGWRPVAHATSVNYARYKDAAYAHDGAGYLETNTRTGGASMAQDVAVTTQPNQSYSFSVWLRTRGSTPVSGTLALWGLGGTAESGQTRFTVGPQWTLVSATLDVANPGHTALRAEIYMGTVNVNLDVDGATLAPGNARRPADTTPPTTTASGVPLGWTNKPVTVAFTALDNPGGSGVASIQYKVGSADWVTGSSVTVAAPSDHSNDGAHTVSYRSSDRAGNVAASKSVAVKIDTTAPAGRFSLAGGAATTSARTITGDSAVSDAHGPLQMRFSLDGKASWTAWTAYAASASLTLPAGLGQKIVHAQYRDAAGNVRELSDAVTLVAAPPDTTAPAVTADGVDSGHHYRTALNVTLSAADGSGGSGVASVSYTLDGISRVVPGTSVSIAVPAQPNGRHTLVYWATDVAGNSSGKQTASFTIDTRGPVCAARGVRGRRGKTIRIQYRATDELSSLIWSPRIVIKNARGKVVKTFKTGANASRKSGTWYGVSWKPRARGTYRCFVYASDTAGNRQRKVGSAKVVVR